MTARVERAGEGQPASNELLVYGTAAVELACQLTVGTYELLGQPVRSIPRESWPGAVRREPRQ